MNEKLLQRSMIDSVIAAPTRALVANGALGNRLGAKPCKTVALKCSMNVREAEEKAVREALDRHVLDRGHRELASHQHILRTHMTREYIFIFMKREYIQQQTFPPRVNMGTEEQRFAALH